PMARVFVLALTPDLHGPRLDLAIWRQEVQAATRLGAILDYHAGAFDVFGNLERDLQTVVRVRPGLFLLAYPQGDPLDLEGDRVQHQLVVEWALTFDVECGSAGHAFSLQVQRQIE